MSVRGGNYMHKYHIKEEARCQKELGCGRTGQLIALASMFFIMISITLVFNYSTKVYNKIKEGLKKDE